MLLWHIDYFESDAGKTANARKTLIFFLFFKEKSSYLLPSFLLRCAFFLTDRFSGWFHWGFTFLGVNLGNFLAFPLRWPFPVICEERFLFRGCILAGSREDATHGL